MLAHDFEVGARVVLSRNHIRNTAEPGAAARVGTVTGYGLTATEWRCGTCGAELATVPFHGEQPPPGVTPCHGSRAVQKRLPPVDMLRFVRVLWDGAPHDEGVPAVSLCRQRSRPTPILGSGYRWTGAVLLQG